MNDELYVTAGSKLYKINSAGTATALGTVTGDGPVTMATNGDILVIVAEPSGFSYTRSTGTFAQITDSVFTAWGARAVAFLDGYFIFVIPNSNQFFNSGLNALTFNALDYTSADAQPGNLTGIMVSGQRQIFLMKKDHIEVWYNAGNATGSPFSRLPSGAVNIGVLAPLSMVDTTSGVYFLANDGTIRKFVGSQPQIVSNIGTDEIISNDDQTGAIGFAYNQKGGLFYGLSLSNATILFNAATGEPHNRESYGLTRWRACYTADVYGGIYAGDRTTGKWGKLDLSAYQEFGDPQTVKIRPQNVYKDGKLLKHKRLELNYNAGEVTVGTTPQCTLVKSDNGGKSFQTVSIKDMPQTGNYKGRLFWTQLGMSRDRVYEFQFADAHPLIAADLQLEVA